LKRLSNILGHQSYGNFGVVGFIKRAQTFFFYMLKIKALNKGNYHAQPVLVPRLVGNLWSA